MDKADKAARIVIPATAGASGRIVSELTLAIVREAQEYFRSLGPADELWSDELLAERRVEAQRESED